MKSTYPFFTLVLILFFFILPTYTTHAENIKCDNVVQALRPCVAFFRGGSGVIGLPPSACCAGVKILSQIANNTANRAALCRCVQSAIKNLRISDATAKALPCKCGIDLPFTFSPYVKCPGTSLSFMH
nr:nonspecific lipid transfer protein 13 [Solanum melongena]WJJ08757.1 nsLTP13 [Solanum melongena]